ncbi:MAG: hypothetical protein IJ409_02155 [Lachnospiraceae bacterium]|nr:hypothetical protein [Lachnospiraceae bacterium]
MKKNRLFAPFLMLLAGAVASIVMRYFRYSTGEMLPILLVVLIIFYFAGCLIQKKVTAFMEQIREEEAKEGEVVEKEVPEDEGSEEEETGEKANNR